MSRQKRSVIGDVTPEFWRLEHPDLGLLEVAVGTAMALRTVDPGFPRRKADAEPETTPAYVVFRAGEVAARWVQIGNHRLALDGKRPDPGELTGNKSAFTGPRVQLRSSMFSTVVRQVTFREGAEVADFDPPAGSSAEARIRAIEASPWKRVAYPLAAGFGKAGWAIAVLVLLPLVGRLLEPVLVWVLSLIPDVEIPWPEFTLPSIPWPDVGLPDWLDPVVEYSPVWIPLVVGIVVAVIAVRHTRRSREVRRRWAEQDRPGGKSDQPDAG